MDSLMWDKRILIVGFSSFTLFETYRKNIRTKFRPSENSFSCAMRPNHQVPLRRKIVEVPRVNLCTLFVEQAKRKILIEQRCGHAQQRIPATLPPRVGCKPCRNPVDGPALRDSCERAPSIASEIAAAAAERTAAPIVPAHSSRGTCRR